MKRWLGVVIVFCGGTVVAGDGYDPVVPMGVEQEMRVRWEIGPDAYFYQYEEPGVMELDGLMYGVLGRVSWLIPRMREIHRDEGEAGPLFKDDLLVFRIEGRYAVGEADYDGALLDDTPYKVSGIDSSSYEFRLLAGYAPGVQHDRMTAFYIGFGYRFKDDDSSFDPAGYKRESTYRYIPILLEHTRTLQNGNDLAFTVEYDHLMSGEQVSDLTSVGGDKLTNDQSSGYGLRGSVAYSGSAQRFDWVIEPYIRYWDIDDSDVALLTDGVSVMGFYEPENNTVELGVSARMVF